ncbi:hypothetical protein SAMN05877831_11828 [Rhodobacter maris]|uniref:Uncharacterized protein n=1 Tax=Rhodobacter maris TaxID=446682 RepID=A0A285TC96_9RHOB|nr:hypothetical protein SAMN05877831_11828 [Rhodobacter maris]
MAYPAGSNVIVLAEHGLAAHKRSEIRPIPPAALNADDHCAGVADVGEKLCPASRTIQAVMPCQGWLENRFFSVRCAAWTYLVRRLAGLIAVFEAVHRSAAPGVRQDVARKLCLKLIPLLQFALKRQNALFYRHLIVLGLYELVEQLENELLGRGEVNFRATKNLLQVLGGFRGANNAGGRRAH